MTFQEDDRQVDLLQQISERELKARLHFSEEALAGAMKDGKLRDAKGEIVKSFSYPALATDMQNLVDYYKEQKLRLSVGNGSATPLNALGAGSHTKKWPKYSRWEYSVVFIDAPDADQIKRIKDFVALVRRTGLDTQMMQSEELTSSGLSCEKQKRMTLLIRGNRAWYDRMATDLKYLYELKAVELTDLSDAIRDDPSQKLTSQSDFPGNESLGFILHNQVSGMSMFCAEDEGTKIRSFKDNNETKLPSRILHSMYAPFNAHRKDHYVDEGAHNRLSSFRCSMIEFALFDSIASGGCDMRSQMNKATGIVQVET
jgi:hypothetical protein